MAMNKQDKLVKVAMEDLRNGSAILTHDWMDRNKCSVDDAMYVAQSIAHAVNKYHFNDAYPHKNIG